MKPVLRPADRSQLAPVGWVAVPVGQWTEQRCNAIYDPARHDILYSDARTTIPVRVGFTNAGYQLAAKFGDQELWYRDRVHAARAALARTDLRAAARTPGADLPGLA